MPRACVILLFATSLVSAADYRLDANVRYASYGETILDVLQPQAPALSSRPTVVIIHGTGNTKDTVREGIAVPFVKHGLVVIDLEYRPAPDDAADVAKALDWISQHAAEYKMDPHRLILFGDGDGSRLALSTAMSPSGRVAAVILGSSPGANAAAVGGAPQNPPVFTFDASPASQTKMFA